MKRRLAWKHESRSELLVCLLAEFAAPLKRVEIPNLKQLVLLRCCYTPEGKGTERVYLISQAH